MSTPDLLSNTSKTLHDVLRVFSGRSSKRRKLGDESATAAAAPDEQKERFVKLASTVLYTDSSKLSETTETQKDFVAQDIQRYQDLLTQETEALEKVKAARKRVHQEQAEIWGVYKYGLRTIMGLNDLSEAPDAILPGNFC